MASKMVKKIGTLANNDLENLDFVPCVSPGQVERENAHSLMSTSFGDKLVPHILAIEFSSKEASSSLCIEDFNLARLFLKKEEDILCSASSEDNDWTTVVSKKKTKSKVPMLPPRVAKRFF